MSHILLLFSILMLYIAFRLKDPQNHLEVWRRPFSKEKWVWLISIVSFVIWVCLQCLHSRPPTLSLFYIGFLFMLIHMVGQWFFLRCDFQRPHDQNTFGQYFVDNILGNLTIRPNQEYLTLCDPIRKRRLPSIIVNRNLSMFFLTLFWLSFYLKLPYLGQTHFQ